MKTESPRSLLPAYAAILGQTVIAAGTFLVAKDATEIFTPLELSFFRIVLSAVLVSVIYLFTHRGRPIPKRSDLWRLLAVGFLGVTVNQSVFLFGIHLSTPLHASLLYAFTPVMVLVGARIWLGQPIHTAKAIGTLLAVIGVALVLTARGLDLTQGPLLGDLMLMVAVMGWAGYTILGKDLLRRHDPFTVITWSFVFGALFVLPAAPWVFSGFDPAAPGARGWLELGWLSLITSGIGFTLWYYALRRLDPTEAAVFTNLQAPFTALLAWLVLGSLPSVQLVAGGILVLAGVTTVQRRAPGRPKQAKNAASGR